MSIFNDHIKKYKPYLKDYDFKHGHTYRLLELQQINLDKEFVKTALDSLKKRIAVNIQNKGHIEKGTFMIGDKPFKGYFAPVYMNDVWLFLEYSKLLKPQQITNITFKELFKNDNTFEVATKKLIENEVLDSSLNWTGFKDDSSLQDKKAICTLAIVLEKKGYLKKHSNVDIAAALTNYFGIIISKQYYGEVKKTVLNNYTSDTKDADYYNAFFFLLQL